MFNKFKDRRPTSEFSVILAVNCEAQYIECFGDTRMKDPLKFTPVETEAVARVFAEPRVEYEAIFFNLVKNGVVQVVRDEQGTAVMFSSPWVRQCYLLRTFLPRAILGFKYFRPEHPNIMSFAMEAISKMNPIIIAAAARYEDGTPTEYTVLPAQS